ncbi:MAG: hypothetical protein IJS15_12395 [Victivallales bacterium]|nr:hypothetical protein [Victivallales bacterium]
MKYTPSTLFKGIRSGLLRQAFDKAGIDLGIDWDKRDQQKDKSVPSAWATYKDDNGQEAAKELHDAFQLVWDFGKAKNSAKELCRQYEKLKILRHPLPTDFDELEQFEVGIHVYVNEGFEMLEQMAEHIAAQDLSIPQQKHWTAYRIKPVPIETTEPVIRRVATALDAFFIQEKKGGNTQIETYPTLYDKLTYFIAKLEDAPETLEAKFEGETDFTDKKVRFPYVVSFCYDSADGRFSLHAQALSKAKMHRLAAIFIKALTGQDVDIERLNRPTYNLSKFAVKRYSFESMADMGYGRVYAEKLGILTKAVPGVEITVKDMNKGDAYDSIANAPATSRLTEGEFKVSRIAIVMVATDKDVKDIRFELTEKTCTHRNLRERQIRMVDELVDRMDIEI